MSINKPPPLGVSDIGMYSNPLLENGHQIGEKNEILKRAKAAGGVLTFQADTVQELQSAPE